MKKTLATLSAAALASAALLVGCSSDAPEETCTPQAMSQIQLQSVSEPLPQKGGGGGGGGGRGGGGGGGGGSKSGSVGGSKSGGSSGGGYSKPAIGSKPSPGQGGVRVPSGSGSNKGYKPKPGQPAPTYVRQPDNSILPFIGGVIVGDALSDMPEGCDD